MKFNKYKAVVRLSTVLLGTLLLSLCYAPTRVVAHVGEHELVRPGHHEDIREPGFPIQLPHKATVTFAPVTGCVVRVAYLLPANRTPQTNAVEKLRWAIQLYHDWYRDQMVRFGFGPKSFRYETEPDGVTPRIYTVPLNVTDEHLRGDIWGRTLSAAGAAGVPVWTARQVWWLIPECHIQSANGAVTGGSALGASFGSGDDAGVALLGSDGLARLKPDYLTNNLSYAGRIISEIGPYPLVANVSFPSFEGTTISSVSSSIIGAALHELSHGFGLPHDFRNDKNFNGNLMGNGLRGFRGAVHPNRYKTDYTRAAYGSLLGLAVSRYFNPPRVYSDNAKPSLSIATRGTNSPVNGLLEVRFTTSDNAGLHAAWLQMEGDLVEEMKLTGRSTNASFLTAYYNPNKATKYTLSVFDIHGNKQSADSTITPVGVTNRAPQPFIFAGAPTYFAGQIISVNGSSSTDPDSSLSSLIAEWDMDGDLVFDTPPSVSKALSRRIDAAGDYVVRLRLTDTRGASTVSAPLSIRVTLPEIVAAYEDAERITLSWPVTAQGYSLFTANTFPSATWLPVEISPAATGETLSVTITNSGQAAFFRLARSLE